MSRTVQALPSVLFCLVIVFCMTDVLFAQGTTVTATQKDVVTLTVSDRPQHQMQSGVGASWHSIIYPTVGHGGSAFGGTPPVVPRHKKLWDSVERHADWLALKFIRLEMDWRQFEPRRGEFTWDSPEMKIVDRICQWSQRRGADVMLQCMWLNVGWLSFPEYAGDPSLEVVSAPADLDAFAHGWVELLREFRERRGYKCIRWINLVNEPNCMWWHIPNAKSADEELQYLVKATKHVRAALKKAGLDVRVMGPDMTGLPELGKLREQPWFEHVDDIDFHSYGSVFDFEDPGKLGGYRIGDRLKTTLAQYVPEAHAAKKGLYLSEAGTMAYGWGGDNPNPSLFRASLKDSELLVRTLQLGIDGFNHWSFTNRGDMDGQWQFVDTWDRKLKQWLADATPHESSYYVLGLAMRHVPKNAIVLASKISGGQVDGKPRVWAVALRSPKDKSLTLIVVNDADQSWKLDVTGKGAARPLTALHSRQEDGSPRNLAYASLLAADGTSSVQLPPFSLTIVTDAPLDKSSPGRF
ncbi:MAG: cellulase family glycosylhydrolase [Pirellulales bacterium]|nr:cellulase family glycosylhydrolase [Pirellulales bacterium]